MFTSILQLLRTAKWPEDTSQRASVSTTNSVQSGYFNFGPRSSRPNTFTQATSAMQDFVRQLNSLLLKALPDATWNAVCVGRNTESAMHRDSGNKPGTMNHTFCVGSFSGGGLWLESELGDEEASMPSGASLKGVVIDTYCSPKSFLCSLWHKTLPYKGERWVVTAYTLSGASPEMLRPLGFPCDAAAAPAPVQPAPAKLGTASLELNSSGPSSKGSVTPAAAPPPKRLKCAPPPSTPLGPPSKPVFLEICSGSAMLSYVAKEAGYHAVPIDWRHNRQRSCVHALQLDLRLPSSWSFLERTCLACAVAWVHMAPPCGTASRARECGPGPKPLRSMQHVRGLPGLSSVDQARVESANAIYDHMAAFCKFLALRLPQVPFSVENPLHSYLWQLPVWSDLAAKHSVVTFDSCRHGSQRKKATALLTNSESLHSLSGPCPGCSKHLLWGRQGKSFATAEETGYPKLLCEKIVSCVDKSATCRGMAPTPLAPSLLSASKAGAQVQPRGRRFPPIISEFAYTMSVSSATAPPLDSKNCLPRPWQSVPAGSKLVRESVERGGSRLPEGSKFYVFGVYRSMQAFFSEAKLVVHPFDSARSLPDGLLRVLFDTLTKSLVDTMKHRLAKLQHWRSLAQQLEPAETKLRSSMDPCVRRVLGQKRVELMRRIASEIEWPDMSLFDDLAAGFKLTGYLERTGVFASDLKPAAMDHDEFWASAALRREALLEKVRCQKDQDFAEELWNMTMEESDQSGKCWLDGPLDVDSLDDIFPQGWNACRRFAVWQGKWRAIDDFSEAAVNACFGAFEKVTLKALDEVCWLCMHVCRAAIASGAIVLELSSGEKLRGRLHQAWHDASRIRPLCKTYDLRAAYKQLPLHPEERPKAVIVLKPPGDHQVKAFVCNTLPFGASASVLQFNRVALFLQRVLWELRVAVACYYDDYPAMAPAFLAGGTDNAVHALMDLLGFPLSEKEKPFATASETLGVMLDTSDAGMERILVANKPERASMLADSLGRILESGQVDTRLLPSLLGRLRFADAQLLGRTGRLALSDLRFFGDRTGVFDLTESQINALTILRARLIASRPRAIATCPASHPVLVFTDGACDPCGDSFETGVGGVLSVPSTGEVRTFGCKVPDKLVRSWADCRKHIIGQVELFAVVLARTCWSRYINGRRCIFFVDHAGVLNACINSNSIDSSWRSLLLHLEAADEEDPCLPWFHRVASKSNIADPPSRGNWDEINFLGSYVRDDPTCFISGEPLIAT